MRVRNLTVSNSRLTEGSYHDFTILKSVDLGGSEHYYVMQDPLGYKVLMPAKFYQKYGFSAGQVIRCRVDRINCSGRMYLEPMHPLYKEGECYDFDVLEYGKRRNILDEEEQFVWVKDALDQKWQVLVFGENHIDKAAGKVKCKLDRIKKGKLYLSIDRPPDSILKTRQVYEFSVIDEKTNPDDNLRYFILEDKMGGKHLLKRKYYTHYRLKKGMNIRCKVMKFTGEGYFILEPENPWFKEGKEYDFKIIELQKLNFSDGSVQDVLVLDDPHGPDDIKVFIDNHQAEAYKKKEEVRCRITRIRKSRIELEII